MRLWSVKAQTRLHTKIFGSPMRGLPASSGLNGRDTLFFLLSTAKNTGYYI